MVKYFLLNRLFEDIEILSNFFDTFIITDARMDYEFEEIKKQCDEVYTIKLIRENYDDELSEEERNHETEKAIDKLDIEFDFVVKNRGLENLKKEALAVVREVENYEGGFDEKN